MSSEAIKLEHITKIYKLYGRNRDRLKDSLGLTKKKCYTEHYALRDVSMEIHQGETVGIIGVNGSGKSTILKIITGVLSATSGTMEINGRISALLELGAGFNMEYTGLENVYLNGTMLGFSEEEINERLQDILDFADIGEFIHQPVKTYSSGMFVRLAFAVAINIDPEILIVDEALSVGDVFFQAKCYHKFEEFKKLGKTILFVSHDLTSIAKYCLSAVAKRNDITLIAVVMAAPDYKVRFKDAASMLNYGFSKCSLYIDKKMEALPEIPVRNGKKKTVSLVYEEQFHYLDTTGQNIGNVKRKLRIHREVKAPVKKNTLAGEMIYSVDGKELGRVRILYGENAGKATYPDCLKKVVTRL